MFFATTCAVRIGVELWCKRKGFFLKVTAKYVRVAVHLYAVGLDKRERKTVDLERCV
jgi:hypothetical protein